MNNRKSLDKAGEFAFNKEKMSKEEIIAPIDAAGHYKVAGEIPDSNNGESKQYDLIIIGGCPAVFAAAIQAEEMTTAFQAYLTLSEAVKLAAIGFEKDVKTLSCCAV